MLRALWLLATLCAGLLSAQSNGTAPSYTSASIVNSASNTPGLAPNGLATIYGVNLSWNTRAVSGDDISAGMMPTALGGVHDASLTEAYLLGPSFSFTPFRFLLVVRRGAPLRQTHPTYCSIYCM